jgi:SpoIID/LytB domain protein
MNKSSKTFISAAIVATFLGSSIGAASASGAAQVPAAFTITGAGFGHGVGMSQYGAQGMGLDGLNATQILNHYYPGTAVTSYQFSTNSIRVGILQDRTFVAVRGELVPGAPSGGGFSIAVDANTPIAVAPGAVATFTTVNGATQVSASGQVVAGTTVTLNWVNADTVMHVRSGVDAASAVAALGTATCIANACSSRYKYGTLEITSGAYDDAIVDLVVVNTLRLSDEYLYGLGEVPSSWTEAAMQAQAIAGRSYAVKKTATRSGCNCQIYSSTLDQAFVGYSKEIATSGNRWVQAVNATIVDANNAYIVTKDGLPISTFYSSSTGGKSQPSAEVWGSAFSYLVSVDDRWSQDPRVTNPNSAWTDSIDQASLVTALRAQGVMVADVSAMTVAENYPSGAIKVLNLTDSAGNVTTLTIAPGQPVTPDELRGVLGTKSTFISAIVPTPTTVPGSPAAVAKALVSVTKVNWPKETVAPSDYSFSGKVSPAQLGATVKLQRKSGGKWKTVSSATTNEKGSWSIVWAGPPAGKHDLRITAANSKGSIKTSTKKITMAGTVSIAAPKSAKRNASVTVSGTAKPGFANVVVTVERKLGNGPWKRVGKVNTDATGKWTIKHNVGSKKQTITYRAKTSDPRMGAVVSKSKKTQVK